MMHVIFLGFALPDDQFQSVIKSDRAMPVQTHLFGWSTIRALESAGVRVTGVSAAPVTTFPNNERIIFRSCRSVHGSTSLSIMGFINLLGLKHVSRYLMSYRVLSSVISNSGCSAILVHGVHSPFLWSALRIGYRHRVPVVAIVTDPPSILSQFDSKVAAIFKRVDRRVILAAFQHVRGTVAVSRSLVNLYAPNLPSIIVDGFVRCAPGPFEQPLRASGRPVVMYAGGLEPSYGVSDLIEARRRSQKAWTLHIYGRGSLADYAQDMAQLVPELHYGGMLSPAELARRYADADFLINPRVPTGQIAEYSFPSKLLEYMSTGKPVISTRLPTISSDLEPYVYWAEAGPEGLQSAIEAAIAEERVVAHDLGQAAQSFVCATRSERAQGARLRDFLLSVCHVRSLDG